MPQPTGIYLPLTLPRRTVGDMLHFARRIPTVPVQRRLHLAPVLEARANASPRPGWCALFTKAYALVCAAHPPLRRAYLSFPWPRLYEHPASVAMIAVERLFGDEPAVFFSPVCDPEKESLADLDARIRLFRDQPLENNGSYRRCLRVGSLPRPLRRWLWWVGLNVSGRKRAGYLGTFGITSYGQLGAASLHPIGVLTTTLSYGPVGPDGVVDVRLVYDHRVLDGGTAARALADLERRLTHELLAELRYLRAPEAA